MTMLGKGVYYKHRILQKSLPITCIFSNNVYMVDEGNALSEPKKIIQAASWCCRCVLPHKKTRPTQTHGPTPTGCLYFRLYFIFLDDKKKLGLVISGPTGSFNHND